ncbi:MAG: SMC family ATPase [Caldilineaceae bacterium]|nr:SMC family ATPase [Caldilineaceae bacterium]
MLAPPTKETHPVQIRSLRLENFKSYADTLIEFTAGTNAIVGHNGAGKSSILEAIGFTLFDYTPSGYSQADFVREGARSATITVSFVSSLDEREYAVIRRCGSSGQYQIFDPELDRKLCEGKADVQQFLRQHLGVESDTDLSDLFSNAVGVPQGMLTSAFLETTARRKPIFDPLLRVEEYRRAYDQLREPERVLGQRQTQLDVQISGLEARLERLPQLEESVAALQESITAGEAELTAVESALTSVQQERQAGEELRRQIADLLAAVNQTRHGVANWEKQWRATQERVDEAVQAQERIEANRAGHEAYQAAQTQQRALEAESRQRQSVRDQLAERDKTISLAKAELTRQQRALAEIEEASRLVLALTDAVVEEDRLEAALRQAERRAARLGDLEKQKKRSQRAVSDAERRLAELKDGLARAQVEDQALIASRARLDEVQLSLVTAREQQIRCQTEADRIKAQIESLGAGDGVTCPVCEQPLDETHRRDLLVRNESHLDDLRAEWKAAQQAVRELEREQKTVTAQAQAHEETLRQLPRAEEGERAAANVEEVRRELSQIEAEIEGETGVATEVIQLQEALAALDHPRRRQEIAAGKVANRERVMAEIERAEGQIGEQSAIMADLQGQLAVYADLDGHIAAVADQLAANRAADDIFRRNEQLAESLPKRRDDAELAQRGLSEAQEQLAAKEEEHRQLSSCFDEERYRQLSSQEEQLRGRQGSLKGQLAEQQKRLAEQEAEVDQLHQRQRELDEVKAQHAHLQQQSELLNYLRSILREAGPFVTRAIVKQISFEAAQIFGELMGDYSRRLQWNEDYGITLEVDGHERQFAQLSGGEQMSAALSVRLALLREMSDIDVAFFDEPTTNLDEARRESLARQIIEIKGFRQLFVISHDDTFEQSTENLVRIQKINGVSVVE